MTDHHIGMIVPSSNLTMETELPRMLREREAVLPKTGSSSTAAGCECST